MKITKARLKELIKEELSRVEEQGKFGTKFSDTGMAARRAALEAFPRAEASAEKKAAMIAKNPVLSTLQSFLDEINGVFKPYEEFRREIPPTDIPELKKQIHQIFKRMNLE